MERYTTRVQINGVWRKVLIYKSDTPLTFKRLDRHCSIAEGEYGMDLLTYVTEPCIYRQFEPTAKDNNYYYWFVVKATERGALFINDKRVETLKDITNDVQWLLNIHPDTLANLVANTDGNYNLTV